MPAIPGLRSPYDLVGGLVHFGRMIDKIRLHDAGTLPADYHHALGNGHDRVFAGFSNSNTSGSATRSSRDPERPMMNCSS